MPTHPNSPRLRKGGIVRLTPNNMAVAQIITLQYNPSTITRSLSASGMGGSEEGGAAKSEVLRLSGPPTETYTLKAEIDATDLLEDGHKETLQLGIQPILSALETILYPTSQQLVDNNRMAVRGMMEILPMEAPLTLFIWNPNRIMPVRFTSFSIEEQAFDTNLNPIRADLTLGMQVLHVHDFGFDHRGGTLYMSYQQNKERLAKQFASGQLSDFGINRLP